MPQVLVTQLHAWEKFGIDLAEEEFKNRYYKKRRSPSKTKVSFARVVQGKVEYLGMVRGIDDPVYLKYYDQYCKLANTPNKRKSIARKPKSLVARVITEGKTDWKHLKIALNKLKLVDQFSHLLVDFHEYGDEMPAGGPEIKEMCARTARLKQDTMTIFVFDCDDKNVLKEVTERDKQYKSWGNNVFSFAIPVPHHREDTPELCIELYYTNEEVTRLDNNGRRLYLSNEFRQKSGRHKTENLVCTDRNKIINDKKITIIDDRVLNEADENVALPKSEFADYIIKQTDNFNDFDYSKFKLVFDIIEQIIIENGKLY